MIILSRIYQYSTIMLSMFPMAIQFETPRSTSAIVSVLLWCVSVGAVVVCVCVMKFLASSRGRRLGGSTVYGNDQSLVPSGMNTWLVGSIRKIALAIMVYGGMLLVFILLLASHNNGEMQVYLILFLILFCQPTRSKLGLIYPALC